VLLLEEGVKQASWQSKQGIAIAGFFYAMGFKPKIICSAGIDEKLMVNAYIISVICSKGYFGKAISLVVDIEVISSKIEMELPFAVNNHPDQKVILFHPFEIVSAKIPFYNQWTDRSSQCLSFQSFFLIFRRLLNIKKSAHLLLKFFKDCRLILCASARGQALNNRTVIPLPISLPSLETLPQLFSYHLVI
jgi:hypothetical protein